MLLLKLTLVPLLIAIVTMAARRWGPRVGGFLLGLPIVAGPTLAFYAVEQGRDFAAEAVRATLLGLVAVAAFCLAYAHAALRVPWPIALCLGWAAFGAVTVASLGVELTPVVGFAAAVVALYGARRFLPVPGLVVQASPPPAWDVPLRMLSAAVLVVILTTAAEGLGPRLSGVLTPFPVAVAIMSAFTHAQADAGAVTRFLRGFLPGLATFAVFCLALAVAVTRLPVAAAFAAALVAQMATQAAVLSRS